jgi:hypothetical protein
LPGTRLSASALPGYEGTRNARTTALARIYVIGSSVHHAPQGQGLDLLKGLRGLGLEKGISEWLPVWRDDHISVDSEPMRVRRTLRRRPLDLNALFDLAGIHGLRRPSLPPLGLREGLLGVAGIEVIGSSGGPRKWPSIEVIGSSGEKLRVMPLSQSEAATFG